jgi:hypothetical protein
MRTAEWSHKTTVEYDQYILPAAVIGQAYRLAAEIDQLEIGRSCVNRYPCHVIFLS